MNPNWIPGRKIRVTVVFVVIGLLFGLMYPIVAREYYNPIAIINGLTIGLLGSLFLSVFELFIQNPLKKRMRFIPLVIFKSVFYTSFFSLLILLVYSINHSLFEGVGYFEYIKSEAFSAFIFEQDFNVIIAYTLLASSAVIFTHQISIKMGQGILLNLIFGKYHNPRNEERIFMFLDLNDSTTLAEKMGPVIFNKFLNQFFYDITDSIVQSYGQIYRYVGDEIVVTWKLSQGIRNIHCLRSYYRSQIVIDKHRESYLNSYGVVPQFSAAFHCGSVVIGQIGDVKSQIVFNGNVLYQTALIEKACRKFGEKMLISRDLMDQLDLPLFYAKKQVGHIHSIELFTLETK